jgi:hypothetical protein
LTPARYENHQFIRYSNINLDDIANATTSFQIELNIPKNLEAISDLNSSKSTNDATFTSYQLSGEIEQFQSYH